MLCQRSSEHLKIAHLKLGNKTANISVKHDGKGDKWNVENSTDHFRNNTRQNPLAAVTNLGHVTQF